MGSTVGLCPPKFPVEDGGTYKFNKFQRWMWECWQEALDEAKSFKPDVLVVNGDEIQGVHDRDAQLWTTKTNIQAEAVLECYGPLCDAVETIYFIRGTSWHGGKCAEHIEDIARQLGGKQNLDTQRYTWWELYLSLGDPVAHFAHKIGVTSIPFYEATVPVRDLAALTSELMRFFGRGAPNLRVIVRSHRHRGLHVALPPNLHAVITPGWQLKTEFVYQRTMNLMLPQIGFVLMEWDGTDLSVRLRTFPLPKPHVEILR